MESLSPIWRLAISGLAGLYLGFVAVRSLQTGVFRYKGRSHGKTEEPKTYWMGVIWFGVLAVLLVGYALYQWMQLTRGTE